MLPDGAPAERAGWQAVFEAGEVLLLLDGRDEVTDIWLVPLTGPAVFAVQQRALA